MSSTPYDGLYKQLFSHPAMVEALLCGFVHEDWVAQVDFSTLEKPNGQYVSEELLQRSDDILWRVRLNLPDDSVILETTRALIQLLKAPASTACAAPLRCSTSELSCRN